jgi:hypothetical protein
MGLVKISVQSHSAADRSIIFVGVLFSLLSSDWSNDPAKNQASQRRLASLLSTLSFVRLSSNVHPL